MQNFRELVALPLVRAWRRLSEYLHSSVEGCTGQLAGNRRLGLTRGFLTRRRLSAALRSAERKA